MAHSRPAVQNPGPAGVVGTIAAAIGFPESVVERLGIFCDVATVCVGPTPGNGGCSGVIVPIVTIGRGCERQITPVAGWNYVIPGSGDDEHRHIANFSL